MSLFISAMDTYKDELAEYNETSEDYKTVGVNGSDVYTVPVGKEQELLALFGALNRNLEKDILHDLLKKAMDTSKFEDLVVLAYHTRDILEGKGERDLFYQMFLQLYKEHSENMVKTMPLISYYGAWFDLQKLIATGTKEGSIDCIGDEKIENHPIIKRAVELYVEQIKKDSLNENDKELSLAAKWVPRENKKNGWLGELVAKRMFPELGKKSYKPFRQMISSINKRLNTVETMMCHDVNKEHHWSEINPSNVPSRCLKMKRKAFFNENKDGSLRHENDEDRMKCRTNFQEHVEKALKGEGKMNGKRLMPHEFIISLEKEGTNKTDRDTLQAQWNDLRKSILDKGSLGKTVVMCDFSGSMCSGDKVRPIDVSKGLGLLCSECTHPAFRDRMLTFDSTPIWHDVSKYDTLYERIKSFEGVSQGMSTDFQAAVDLILKRLVEAKVPVGEEPDILLVLTDMGWNEASYSGYSYKDKNFETHIDRIKREFKDAGNWKVPTIVVWNISGKFQEYHHESNTEGTCTISGWSPSILKFIMNGDNIVEKMKDMTPHRMMRDVLDDPRYDPIRSLFASS